MSYIHGRPVAPGEQTIFASTSPSETDLPPSIFRRGAPNLGTGRCGAGHLHLQVATEELQRRKRQEPRGEPVALAPVSASFRLTTERDQDEAEGESKAAGGKAHARDGTEVAVLPWSHRASHEGLQTSGAVIWCVHRDASCYLHADGSDISE